MTSQATRRGTLKNPAVRLTAILMFLLGSVLFGSSQGASAAARLEINYGTVPVTTMGDGNTDATVRNQYAWGTFNDNGDKFFVLDSYPDSMRVALHWKLKDGSRQGLCINKVGFWRECDKDLPEHKTVLIRVGRCDGDVSSCTALSQYRDWTAYDSTSTS
jgi:hypothetical protein